MEMILMSTEEKMEKAIETLNKHLVSIRTGRANPAMLEHVEAIYYGSPTPINQMSAISVVEGRQLMIKPFDKSAIKDIEKAINEQDLGYPVQNDGDLLRINIPPLTEERRKEFTKDASKCGEEAKVAIRNIRRDANDAIKKDKELPEDVKKDGQEQVQKLTDDFVKKIDSLVADKTKEIMVI